MPSSSASWYVRMRAVEHHKYMQLYACMRAQLLLRCNHHSCMQLKKFLEQLELGHYYDKLIEEEVDSVDTLRKMSDRLLETISIKAGARAKILDKFYPSKHGLPPVYASPEEAGCGSLDKLGARLQTLSLDTITEDQASVLCAQPERLEQEEQDLHLGSVEQVEELAAKKWAVPDHEAEEM